MQISHRRLIAVIAGALTAALTAGCMFDSSDARQAPELPFNAELSASFRDILTARDIDGRHLGLVGATLFCEKLPGPVKVQFVLDVRKKKLLPPVATGAACTEQGILVEAHSTNSRGQYRGQAKSFNIYSKQAYEKSIVDAEWHKALDVQFGTFAFSSDASAKITSGFAAALNELDVRVVKFSCEKGDDKVGYEAQYLQGWRTVRTTVKCKDVVDSSEILAEVSGTPALPSSSTLPEYRVSAVKAVNSELAARLVGDFLREGSRRNTF